MSLEQYNSILSSMLKQKWSLARLREELKERKGKLCFSCKKFGHLAWNCRNKKEEEKGTTALQNKFEVLSSRVMQCEVEERVVRRQEVAGVECLKRDISVENIQCRERQKREELRKWRMWQISQMVTYLVCDELKYGFKSAYEQS